METREKVIYGSFAEACRKTKISRNRLNRYIEKGIHYKNYIWYESN